MATAYMGHADFDRRQQRPRDWSLPRTDCAGMLRWTDASSHVHRIAACDKCQFEVAVPVKHGG